MHLVAVNNTGAQRRRAYIPEKERTVVLSQETYHIVQSWMALDMAQEVEATLEEMANAIIMGLDEYTKTHTYGVSQ